MRRRFAIALIALVGASPWVLLWAEEPPQDQQAVLFAKLDVPRNADWIGGFSGIETTPDGNDIVVVTDKGHIARGTLARDDATIRSVSFSQVQRLVDANGTASDFPDNDAEGLAVDDQGRIFVSFEHTHRVLAYDTWDAHARRPSYTRAWRALADNRGLEAIAVTGDGTLLTLPEQVNGGAYEALLYTKHPSGRWKQELTLPVSDQYKPVGADFGPDGRLYLLERQFAFLGFRSRVRVLTPGAVVYKPVATVLQTAWGDHGNLEGIAVWQDMDGNTRLTMVSDDNFHWFMRGQIVEYILKDGVAPPPQSP